MISILDGDDGKPLLYVGDDADDDKAREQNFAILRCAKDGPHGHRHMLGYTTLGAPKDQHYYTVETPKAMGLNLIDVDDPQMIRPEVIIPGLRFIAKHLKAGDKVLVHCNAGHSRGPTMAMMFLRSVGELPYTFPKSEKIFKTLYPKYSPAKGVREFAREHWGDLLRIKY